MRKDRPREGGLYSNLTISTRTCDIIVVVLGALLFGFILLAIFASL